MTIAAALAELREIYLRDALRCLADLRRSQEVLATDPHDQKMTKLAFCAAHQLKGSSWTLRDAPCNLGDAPSDERYAPVAQAAEALEAHLGTVLDGSGPLDLAMLIEATEALSAILSK